MSNSLPEYDKKLFDRVSSKCYSDQEAYGQVIWLLREYHDLYQEMKHDESAIPIKLEVYIQIQNMIIRYDTGEDICKFLNRM